MQSKSKNRFIFQIKPSIGKEERKALNDYMLSNGWLTEYEKTKYFENKIADFTNSKHCIATNNGTIALTISAIASGVNAGDEVIIPNYTMIGTANSIKILGAKPVFVDVEEATLCLELNNVKNKISSRTKAIILVSPNGRYPKTHIKEYENFCKKNNLVLIEDAAQSLGSIYPDGRSIGTVGLTGIYSLTPHKIISTGQGGLIVTNDSKIAKSIKKIKDFGRPKPGIDLHDSMGYNFKFTDIQSVIGIEQLKKIKKRIKIKKKIFKYYKKSLKDLTNIKFYEHNLNYTSPLFVDCLLTKKNKLKKYLYDKGIGTRDMYPPLNKQKVFNEKENFRVSNLVGKQGLWLPSSVDLTQKEIDYVCNSIKEFYT